MACLAVLAEALGQTRAGRVAGVCAGRPLFVEHLLPLFVALPGWQLRCAGANTGGGGALHTTCCVRRRSGRPRRRGLFDGNSTLLLAHRACHAA